MVQFIPNMPKAVMDYLETISEFDDVTFSDTLTGYVQGDTWVRMVEVPGYEAVRGRLFVSKFDFNVYAGSIESCRSVAVRLFGYLSMMKGWSDSNVVVTHVEADVLPFNFTDIIDGQPRYVFTMAFYCRPN